MVPGANFPALGLIGSVFALYALLGFTSSILINAPTGDGNLFLVSSYHLVSASRSASVCQSLHTALSPVGPRSSERYVRFTPCSLPALRPSSVVPRIFNIRSFATAHL